MHSSGKRVAVLGTGKLGGILLKALLEKGLLARDLTSATVQHEDRAQVLAQKLGIPVGTDNAAAVRDADIIFVCVKPQVVETVMQQIRSQVSPNQLISTDRELQAINATPRMSAIPVAVSPTN